MTDPTATDGIIPSRRELQYRYVVDRWGKIHDLEQYNNHHRKQLKKYSLKRFTTLKGAIAYVKGLARV